MDLTANRWERAKEIFEKASELPGDALADFLLDECDGDKELLAEVMSLLDADREEHAALAAMEETVDRVADSGPIGPYHLKELLGQGGMGEVWLAEQSEPVRREVALKIVKLGMDTKQVLARFEAERQALAMLEHENIARLFDAGMTDDGRPYFVMELVRGVPITDYCDAEKLDIDDRVELFGEVCRAVHHAHKKGLVHRDLKPSNILVSHVDGRATIKLIDFGIAKALAGDLTDLTLHTRHDQIIGTPEYMSPEQAGVDGLDIDGRADVFSLGVVLYELLVGSRPHDLGASTLYGALAEVLRHRDTPAPSSKVSVSETELDVARARATSPSALRRQLRSGLDPIVMTALERDRESRYQSAHDLADDLDRFRSGERLSVRQGARDRFVRSALRAQRRHGATLRVAAGLVLIGIVTWAGALAAQGPSVAVLPMASFQGDGAFADYVSGAQSLVMGEFRAADFEVTPPDEISAALTDLGIDSRDLRDEDVAVSVGRELGVDYVVSGASTMIVDNVRLDVVLLGVQEDNVVTHGKFSGRTTDIFPMLRGAAADMIEALGGEPLPGSDQALAARKASVVVMPMASYQGNDDRFHEYVRTAQTITMEEFRSGGYVVVPRRDIENAIEEDLLTYRDFNDEGVVLAIGRYLRADYVVTGMSSELVDRLRVQTKVWDVAERQVVGEGRGTGWMADAAPILRSVADQMMAGIEGREPRVPLPDTSDRPLSLTDTEPDTAAAEVHPAGMVLVTALAMLSRGEIDLAIEMTESVIAEYPDFEGAREVRQRIRDQTGR